MDYKLLHILKEVSPDIAINSKYQSEKYLDHMKSTLKGGTEDSRPFPHFALNDFISDASFLSFFDFACHLTYLWQKNSNDLYSNADSFDLQLNPPDYPSCLIPLRDFFVYDVREWLAKASGYDLISNVSISLARYKYTDVLLPHDDQTEGRKFAFVFYLSSDWTEKSGGELALFDCDEDYRPLKEVKFISPKQNTLALFEVSPSSWHMVKEILDPCWKRVSLHGWFHVANSGIPVYIPSKPVRHKLLKSTAVDEPIDWINPQYLDEANLKAMQETFKENGSIKLEKFLKPEVYAMLLEQLEKSSFREEYLPHRRRVMNLDIISSYEDVLKNSRKSPKMLKSIEAFHHFLSSSKFAKFLITVSNLLTSNMEYLENFEKEADENEEKEVFDEIKFVKETLKRTKRFTSFRRFGQSCYQLIDDELIVKNDSDYVIDFQCHLPEGNVAIITHRRANEYFFIKYINNMAFDSSFYLLNTSIFGTYLDMEEAGKCDDVEMDTVKPDSQKKGYVAKLLERVAKETEIIVKAYKEKMSSQQSSMVQNRTEELKGDVKEPKQSDHCENVKEIVPSKVRKFESQAFREDEDGKLTYGFTIGDPEEVKKILSLFVDSNGEEEME